MSRSLFVLPIVVFSLCAADIQNFRYIPDDFIILLREESTLLFRDLSDADKATLKDVQSQKKTYKGDEEALQALRDRSETLYAQFNHYYKLCRSEVEPLGNEAKNFVYEVVEKIRSLRPADGERYKKRYLLLASGEVLYKYNTLSDKARDEIQQYLGLGSTFKTALSGAGELIKNFTSRFTSFFNKS
ncbi:hypothetical protein QR680_014552 [Steinernema hermaphroditum]|uniref:Fatty-acid and retinol-binding protein 1 n=1 Tax=Steinernema hermaphroditum TaxID=289476 RepID=A0AA39I992_9BILA|nr:hypothetical protein QR680_014552 [Steinernema hermaphroditum]